MVRTLMHPRLATMLAAEAALRVPRPHVAAHLAAPHALQRPVPVDAAGVLACAMGGHLNVAIARPPSPAGANAPTHKACQCTCTRPQPKKGHDTRAATPNSDFLCMGCTLFEHQARPRTRAAAIGHEWERAGLYSNARERADSWSTKPFLQLRTP